MFKKLEQTSKYLVIFSAALSLFFLVAGFIVLTILEAKTGLAKNLDYIALIGGKFPYVLGVIFGEFFTVIKIILIDKSCKKAVEMEVNASKVYGMGAYFSRFILTAIVLLIAIWVKPISFLGTVLGTLSLQFAGYLTPMWQEKEKKQSTKNI